MVDKFDDGIIENAGKASIVQNDQQEKIEERINEQSRALKELNNINKDNSDALDELLVQAKNMLDGKNVNLSAIEKNNIRTFYEVPEFEPLDIIEFNDINSYMGNVQLYAQKNNVDLTKDPFETLLSLEQRQAIAKRLEEDYKMRKANCDKYDYCIAAFSGVLSGLVDSFFVGMPGDSKLENWSNDATEKIVIKFAELITGKKFDNDHKGLASAIRALENDDRFAIHYDQQTGKAAGSIFNMSALNHHMKSLAHSPDLVGLIFSIIDQISGTSHFVDNGRLITYQVPNDKIIPPKGNNLIENIFYGVINWFVHILSDVAGSSGTRSKDPDKKGMGIPIPGFELLQFIGKKYDNDIDIKKQKRSVADFAVDMFENNYDFRFGAAQSIPVVMNELLIRFSWGIKQRYYHEKPWKECIPKGSIPELRRMLLCGHGVLCLVDITDAGIRTALKSGDFMQFALRTNFVAWQRFAIAGLIEVRAIYSQNAIDVVALDSDLEHEWNSLLV